MLTNFGVSRSNMDVFFWMPLLSVLVGTLVSIVIIYLFSGRIKRISAYALISE